jgi:hypothetical protein
VHVPSHCRAVARPCPCLSSTTPGFGFVPSHGDAGRGGAHVRGCGGEILNIGREHRSQGAGDYCARPTRHALRQEVRVVLGRSSRNEFWWWYLANFVIVAALPSITNTFDYVGATANPTTRIQEGVGSTSAKVLMSDWPAAILAPTPRPQLASPSRRNLLVDSPSSTSPLASARSSSSGTYCRRPRPTYDLAGGSPQTESAIGHRPIT